MGQCFLKHKVAHLPWVVRRALVGKAVTDTADAVTDAALAISNCQVQQDADEDEREHAQLELPMRHRRMGPHRLPPVEGACHQPPLSVWQ